MLFLLPGASGADSGLAGVSGHLAEARSGSRSGAPKPKPTQDLLKIWIDIWTRRGQGLGLRVSGFGVKV